MSYSLYLCHGGPGSGRYPLGSGERPYQGAGGSSRSSKGLGGYIRSRRAQKRAQQAKIAEQERRRLENDKERVLQSGTASEVRKYRGKLTKQELTDVYSRLNLERNIANMSKEEKVSAMSKVQKVVDGIDTATKWAVAGVVAYNVFGSIYNSTEAGQAAPLKTISIKRGN